MSSGANETLSWLGGIFMFAGYLVHLTLDEMYSVDVMDVRVKASFGTALKLYDTKHLGHSGAMAVATVLAFLVTPPFWATWKAVAQPEIRAGLQERLLPKQTWFGFIAKDFRMPPALRRATASDAPADGPAAKAALTNEPRPTVLDASPITTGSIAQPAAPASADTQSPCRQTRFRRQSPSVDSWTSKLDLQLIGTWKLS